MQLRDAYPDGTAGGCDFVSLSSEVAPGDRIVDLDRDLDVLPAWGRLCIHENTVKQMMAVLGWEYDPVLTSKVKEQAAEIARLRKANKKFRDALVSVVEAATDAGLNVVVTDDDRVPA
jgi:hypothetical protein